VARDQKKNSVGHGKPPAGDCETGSPSGPKSSIQSAAELDQDPLAPNQEPTATPLPLSERLALRPEELAARLGIAPRTLRSIARELPRIRRKGLPPLYPVRGIEAWLERESKVEGDQVRAVVRELLAKLEASK
jgi:hypothetical protein